MWCRDDPRVITNPDQAQPSFWKHWARVTQVWRAARRAHSMPPPLGSPEIFVPEYPEQHPSGWCHSKLPLDKATWEQDSALQMPSKATAHKSGFSWCETIPTCLLTNQRRCLKAPGAAWFSPGPRDARIHTAYSSLLSCYILLRCRWNTADEFPHG